MSGKPVTSAYQNWSAWADRAIRRGKAEASRALGFLDRAPADHPDIKGLAPDQRAALRARLERASKGA